MLYDFRKDLDEDSKTFLKARDYIQEHGWCQGDFENDKGEVCMAGALRKALNLHGIRSPSSTFMQRLFDEIKFVGTWNDTKGRTKEEVIAVLEKLAYRS